MHYAQHIRICLVALWIVPHGGDSVKTVVNPDVITNFAKNVATALSPALLGEAPAHRTNRSSAKLASPSARKSRIQVRASSTPASGVGRLASLEQPATDRASFREGHNGLHSNPRNEDPRYPRQLQPYFGENYFGSAALDESKKFDLGESVNGNPSSDDLDRFASESSKRLDSPIAEVAGGFSGPQLAFTKFTEDNYQKAGTRFLHGPPHAVPGHFFASPHGYPPYPYDPRDYPNGPYAPGNPSSAEQPENGQVENGSPTSQPPPNGGPHFRFPGFDPYGHPPPFPNYAQYNYNHRNPSDQSERTSQSETDDSSKDRKYQQPYGPPFINPLFGSFHLQGYPSPTYNLFPSDHFNNVFNKSYHGAPYPNSPFAPFPPVYNFYLPTAAPPTTSTSQTSNGNVEKLNKEISESKLNEIRVSRLDDDKERSSVSASARDQDIQQLIDRILLIENDYRN